MNKKLFAAGAIAALTPVFLIKPGRPSPEQKKTFMGVNFAHRGLHSKDCKIPENSLPAFKAAAEAGYGMELDVQLTKDGKVVVFHDDTLDRVCGIRGRVDEFTFSELCGFRLENTDETIPLFTEVLSCIAGRGPLIVELKTGPRNNELCRKTFNILETYDGPVCIESFNPMIVAWFRLHGRKYLRGQLSMTAERYEFNKSLNFILSRCVMNFLARPQFIAYDVSKPMPAAVKLICRLGALNFGWTSHDASNEQGRDGVIFEFYKPDTKFKVHS